MGELSGVPPDGVSADGSDGVSADGSRPDGLPLSGVQVVDLSTSYAGPTASMYLADMGAEVLKVERPPDGDDAREWGPPFVDGTSAWFQSANRNKQGVALDLNSPEGRSTLDRLLESADVLIESFNPSKLARLGLEPADVMARHERIIYCAFSGFGFTGPDATNGGYDLAAQARSGLMSVTGAKGGLPQRVSTALSDIVTGIVAAFAIAANLQQQARTGRGEFIDVSLLETDLALMAPRITSYLAGEPEPAPSGGTDSVLAVYQTFETADRSIAVAIGNDPTWSRFCDVVGLPELGSDPALATNAGRREARPTLIPAIAARLKTRPAAEWLTLLDEAGVPSARVQTLSEVVSDPQVVARGAIGSLSNGVEVVMPPWRLGLGNSDGRAHRAPPPLGGDTVEVLRRRGFTDNEIRGLAEQGAIPAAPELMDEAAPR